MKKSLLFVGPIMTASGYGTHARQLLRALVDSDRFEIYVEPIKWGETPFLTGQEVEWITPYLRQAPANPELAIEVTIPNEFKRRGKITIGVTAGIEVDRVSPEWLAKCNAEVDLVVVPSNHSGQSFAVQYSSNTGQQLKLERQLAIVAEGVDTQIFKPAPTRSAILDKIEKLPIKNFICVGLGLDKPNGSDRKNITKLIEWFAKTFNGNNHIGLILKTSIIGGSIVDFEITKKRILDIKTSAIGNVEFPRISLLHGRMTSEEMSAVYNDSRVIGMVSLTHGEGFGLPLIEAAACGLPVVATDWSGHVDFLTKDGKKLFIPVEYDLAQIPQDCVWNGVMEAGSIWANPKESDFQLKARKLFMSDVKPREWAAELAAHIAENYSLQKTGEQFVEVVSKAISTAPTVVKTRDDLIGVMRSQIREKGKSLVYTMPMSAGDVFLSTAVVEGLKKRHPEHRIYFATLPQYFQIIEQLDFIDERIEWMPWMQDISVLEDIFDEVYTPNLNIQMAWSNWVHRGQGRQLLDEMAVQCGFSPQDSYAGKQIGIPMMAPIENVPQVVLDLLASAKLDRVAIHVGGQKSARAYAYWRDLVKNMRDCGIYVVQVGAADDTDVGEVDQDVRGMLSPRELPSLLKACKALVCIDSFPMHVAACYGIPVVAIFGSSYASSTGPQYTESRGRLKVLLETEDRHGCDRACYKDVCKVDSTNPCINEIPPSKIWDALGDMLGYSYGGLGHGHDAIAQPQAEPLVRSRDGAQWPVYKEFRPKIAGYTHVYNAKSGGYPYIQSISSMTGFCDEIIVVDGGSTDGTLDEIRDLIDSNRDAGGPEIKIVTNPWDPDEPGMDGMQKAFGRAMVSSDVEFLWQQDADEVVHERDYKKIVDLCRRFPSGVDVVHLPVVELWGDARTCRTDRHSWKWRLTRNNFRITHGINIQARRMDQKTGRFYAERGMSDGCELIDIVTGQHLPHAGFYNEELDRLRREEPQEYGRQMNRTFAQLPSVWHYSWANLNSKVRQFVKFWDRQWSTLYQTPPTPRFPGVETDEQIAKAAEELKARGGEHGNAQTFNLEIDQPEIMQSWKS